jgi:hypothetical protein
LPSEIPQLSRRSRDSLAAEPAHPQPLGPFQLARTVRFPPIHETSGSGSAGAHAAAGGRRALFFVTRVLTVASNLTIAIAVGTFAGLALRLLRQETEPAEWTPADRSKLQAVAGDASAL